MFDSKIELSKGGIKMMKRQLKSVIKTGIGVAFIYMVAVMLSLFMCDRMSELNRYTYRRFRRQNSNIVLQIK